MATVKIVTSAKHKHGQKNVIPHLKGETFISIEGIVECPDLETAQKVITSVPDFSLYEPVEEVKKEEPQALKPKAEEDKLGKEAGSELTSETGDNGKKDDDADKDDADDAPMSDEDAEATLKGKTLVQLQTMAKDAGLPEDKWAGLQKPDLKTYLKGILTGTIPQ